MPKGLFFSYANINMCRLYLSVPCKLFNRCLEDDNFDYTVDMKYILILTAILSFNTHASECVLSAGTHEDEKIQTSFQTSTSSECRDLASKIKENHFFGLIDENTELVNIKYIFQDETGATKEEI